MKPLKATIAQFIPRVIPTNVFGKEV